MNAGIVGMWRKVSGRTKEVKEKGKTDTRSHKPKKRQVAFLICRITLKCEGDELEQ